MLTAVDVGATIRIVVTATNSSGSATATSSPTTVVTSGAALAPTNIALPTISGDATEGETLTGLTGSWSGTTPIAFAYQWRRCDIGGANCSNVGAATEPTYTLGTADVGTTLRVLVTASNDAGSSVAASVAKAVVAAAAPLNTVEPTITGVPQVGSLLSASPGTWTGTSPISYAYQWRRCDTGGANCTSISGATAPSYGVAAADAGSTLRLVTTASNGVGSNVATSAQTPS